MVVAALLSPLATGDDEGSGEAWPASAETRLAVFEWVSLDATPRCVRNDVTSTAAGRPLSALAPAGNTLHPGWLDVLVLWWDKGGGGKRWPAAAQFPRIMP